MLNWNNLDTTRAFEDLKKAEKVDLTKAVVGESGAERVRKYHVPMAAGLDYSFAAKNVDDNILEKLAALPEEQQLVDRYESLLNGDIINTG